MQIHLIAIGGAVMHNLAIALKTKGLTVTGSDDEIFEPSLSRLQKHNLLPKKYGWYPENIHSGLDAVILGMHARADNPELLRAKELNLNIYSFPEYIYEQSKNKIRVAVCGSHGKTTITSMIMHVLKDQKLDFDYLVGAQLAGFETMVQISDAPLMIIEGDEYFASPLDKRPKFLHYKAQITLISGIAWDHFNVFPTFENYTNQFKILMESLSPQQLLILNEEDQNINSLLNNSKVKAEIKKYSTPDYFLENNAFHLQFENKVYIFEIFGKHNMQNMEAARLVCNALNIENDVFYSAMESFKGAAKRLEILYKNDSGIVFRDFAHAPSKVQATVDAVKEQYPERKLIACLELHTFSSLNKTFIAHYKNTMNKADVRIVYFNPHTVQLKKLPELLPEEVKHFFNDDSLHVINNSAQLSELLKMLKSVNTNFLLMSSGNFDNLEFTILT
ncbi:MAG: peptidoglycan synthetase [Bacteroidetes bacterium]|jgi:UDP-N-acetylmuramate: L-alanyl-gamma-D-glutamyl-meso-diaminopimelate ligase|nr:peptidoglycan synthetase [Bacteroidota bacterium]